jgi:hypothetical protein
MKSLFPARLFVCRFSLLAVCALALSLVPAARAAVSHQLIAFDETNYTGYVISSDKNNANAAYNRDAIEVTAQMRFTRSGTNNHHYMHRFRFRLLDEDGNAHTLDLPGGTTGTTLEVFEEVNMTPVAPTVTDRFIQARVAPAAGVGRMNPYKNYRVEMTVARRLLNPMSVTYVGVAIIGQTDFKTYKHFPQLFVGDAAVNAITELLSASVSRPYRVQTDAGNDAFRVTASVRTHRYDEFNVSPTQTEIITRVSVVLRDDLGNTVPLQQSSFEFTHQQFTYDSVAFNPIEPSVRTHSRILNLRPVGQLPSRDRTYTATVSVGHFETPIFLLGGNQLPTSDTRLLDFNGTLVANGVTGSFTSIATPGPAEDGLGAGYVLTSLRVNNQSGQLLGMTFGNGAELPVRLANNGVATLDSGSINFSGSGLPLVAGNLFYSIHNAVATPTGFTGTVRLRLPAGLGLGFDSVTRIHEPTVDFPGVALTNQLTPVDDTLSVTGNWWASEESKPFIFEADAVTWEVDHDRLRFNPTGEAEYVRREAVWSLVSDPDVPFADRSKPSNDLYYFGVNGVTSAEAVVNIDANASALLTIDISLHGVGILVPYRAHFPLGMELNFVSASQRIVDDRVVPSFGGLNLVSPISLPYTRDCPLGDCGGVAGAQTLTFLPESQHVRFTRDGGLAASGSLDAPHVLRWGWIADKSDFAHSVFTFDDAGFHMPGAFLAASQVGAVNPVQRPARLLYTGVDPNAADTVERPGTGAYNAGLGDYAGLNFRVVDWGDQDGRIVLAGQVQPNFPLTNRAKYLVRLGGVTGIHEAITGLFNPTATIYGVDFEFATLGWGFLDGQAVPALSRTSGNLYVQFPSDFDLDFDKLMISCLGALEGAEISPADHGSFKKLAYWNADFRPLALSFEGKADALCDPSDRRLVLGVEAFAGGIPQPLSGRIAFQLNGNLVTLGSGDLDPPFDSRFRLPNNFTLAGPGNQTYRATAVGEAYLNDWAAAPAADFGWMNIIAYLDVPFFADLETHIHTSAVKDDENVLYHIMGGYPKQGYNKNGDHFFNQTIFDVSNRGFPLDVTFQQYREGVAKYRPVAFKRWLGIVDLEYPLTWRPASRSFVSFEDQGTDLLVLHTEHRVDYLSPDFVEISFGASLSIAPTLNLANFVADKATDVLTVLNDHLNTEVVDRGVAGLNEILDVKQREFFALALQPAINTTVDAVMDAVGQKWNPGAKNWGGAILVDEINKGLLHVNNGLVPQVRQALEAAAAVGGVLQEISLRLEQADEALEAIESFIAEKDGKALGNLEDTVVGLASLVSAALDKPEFKEKIEAILAKAEPRIIEVRNVIGEIRDYMGQVQEAMEEGGAFLAQVTDLVDSSIGLIEGTVDIVRNDILAELQAIKLGVDSFPAKEAAIRAEIKQRMEDYILGLRVVADFNRLVKQRVYDTAALFTAAIDEVFDQINLTVREVVRETVGGLDDKFNEMLGDDISTKMATADIKGYAKIRNDSLTELRLDLKAQLNIPDEMKVHVFLLIRELNSENTGSDCLPASGKATEVTMGAKDMAVEWLFPGTSASIQAKFLFETMPDETLALRGFGGGFELEGEISFAESVKILKLGASVMFGADEFYISAAAGVEVQGFAGVGGIFLGRACSLEPFFWDETVATVLGDPPFTGMYGYGEFWIPIPTLIGIPSTCLFNLSAGVGAGAGFFLEGPTVFGKMFLGVSGDVLCIISITGEISLVGLARPTGLALAGQGRFKAKIGYCPLCLKVEKSILLARENKKWTRSVK